MFNLGAFRRLVSTAIAFLFLLAAEADADERSSSSSVVHVDSVPLLSRATTARGDIGNIATILFRGDVCRSEGKGAGTPRWSCQVDGSSISGFAPLSALRAADATDAGPDTTAGRHDGFSPHQVMLNRANAEPNAAKRERLLVEGHFASFRYLARRCAGGSYDHCWRAAQTRINLYWTANALRQQRSLPTQVSRANEHACVAGVSTIEKCLENWIGPGWLATAPSSSPDQLAFVRTVKHDDGRVRFVTGTAFVKLETGQPLRVRVLTDEAIAEPLFPASNFARPVSLGLRELVESRGYLVPTAGRTLRMPRRLGPNEAISVFCMTQIQRVTHPLLQGIGVAEVEWGDGGVFPEYRYALPCDSVAVVDGAIVGLLSGPFRTSDLAVAVPSGSPRSPFSECFASKEKLFSQDNRGCFVNLQGDFNGDGRHDAIITTYGEMGCGGTTLYLSNESGWESVARQAVYC